LFSDIDVLQGSVATRIRCDGVFNKGFIANFLENLSVKKIENRFRFDEVTPVMVCDGIFLPTSQQYRHQHTKDTEPPKGHAKKSHLVSTRCYLVGTR